MVNFIPGNRISFTDSSGQPRLGTVVNPNRATGPDQPCDPMEQVAVIRDGFSIGPEKTLDGVLQCVPKDTLIPTNMSDLPTGKIYGRPATLVQGECNASGAPGQILVPVHENGSDGISCQDYRLFEPTVPRK